MFSLTPAGSETILHSFAGGSDGDAPQSGLIAGSSKVLYGITNLGGGSQCGGTGCGTVYRLDLEAPRDARHHGEG